MSSYSKILKKDIFCLSKLINCALAGTTRVESKFMELVTCIMRYKLQTFYMLIDMNSMNPNGTTKVMIIEFSAIELAYLSV